MSGLRIPRNHASRLFGLPFSPFLFDTRHSANDFFTLGDSYLTLGLADICSLPLVVAGDLRLHQPFNHGCHTIVVTYVLSGFAPCPRRVERRGLRTRTLPHLTGYYRSPKYYVTLISLPLSSTTISYLFHLWMEILFKEGLDNCPLRFQGLEPAVPEHRPHYSD